MASFDKYAIEYIILLLHATHLSPPCSKRLVIISIVLNYNYGYNYNYVTVQQR